MYIRKDIISQIWDYGTAPAIATTAETDPYADKMIQLSPDMEIGETGTAAGQLQTPRGIAVGPDGSIYVADSHNNRIQRFSAEGQLLNSWGTFGDALSGDAPGGTFNEPWDVAVAADGSVFVADTWNHRIQKFTADGQFIKMWGHYVDQGQGPEGFWGPRGIAIDSQGWVYVADTGNKRVVIFDSEGQYINQFGSSGADQGQLDEPVGIAVDPQERIFVADTWNQRVQVFTRTIDTSTYQANTSWDISGWFGQSLDNKPYIDVDGNGNVFVTDPEGYRVLEFDSTGNFIRGWGDYSPGIDGFGLTSGVAVDSSGGVWVSDSANNRLLHFTLP
jgi:DNA-binding beta-propeller fold protein YncE